MDQVELNAITALGASVRYKHDSQRMVLHVVSVFYDVGEPLPTVVAENDVSVFRGPATDFEFVPDVLPDEPLNGCDNVSVPYADLEEGAPLELGEASLSPPAPRLGDWIQTVSGKQYWPLDPRPEEIDITDVAHALGMLCRFTGHCRRFYSVAEHSVHVLFVMHQALRRPLLSGPPPRTALRHALLHDGPEAYINDIARPVKRSIQGYTEIERLNETAFAQRFALPYDPTTRDLIKLADNAMLLAEQAVLMASPPVPWAPVDVPGQMITDAHLALARSGKLGWSPDRAAWEFLHAYKLITP